MIRTLSSNPHKQGCAKSGNNFVHTHAAFQNYLRKPILRSCLQCHIHAGQVDQSYGLVHLSAANMTSSTAKTIHTLPDSFLVQTYFLACI